MPVHVCVRMHACVCVCVYVCEGECQVTSGHVCYAYEIMDVCEMIGAGGLGLRAADNSET